MRVGELDVPEECRRIIEGRGIEELNPPQEEAARAGFGRNMVVAAPTASGKTLIAEIASIKKVVEEDKKVVYIVPLRALAQEKYEEFKNYPFKTALSVGDLDSPEPWLAGYDFIIATSEKMDSLLRHNPPWVEDIGLVVADEIHLLGDQKRGPTLEVVLTNLRKNTDAQILALSATVKNAEEIGDWLGAETIRSEYRPVKLTQGVFDGERLRLFDEEAGEVEERFNGRASGELLLAENTVGLGKQALIFASTKKNAESIAEKAGRFLMRGKDEKRERLADKILKALSRPTKQCERLARCVKAGTAFHHAGLARLQRLAIENAFREGQIDVVAATPTLAFGVNLPAYRVLIRDAMRYYPGQGLKYIPVLEYTQMTGRAGRPSYDTEGQAILIARNRGQAGRLTDRFIGGEPEKIYSRLSAEPALRTHTLSLITVGLRTTESLREFFSKTFFAHQFGTADQIESKIGGILERLSHQGFINWEGQQLQPTRIGKRVAELYLDPESAHLLSKAIRAREKGAVFSYLVLISRTSEMDPLYLRKGEETRLSRTAALMEGDIFDMPDPWDSDFDRFLEAVKTAAVLNEWIDEQGENRILDHYGVTPGILRAKLEMADWLLYSCQELAHLLRRKDKLRRIKKLRIRVKNGVREELLPLMPLKGIGRVRARKLFGAGFSSPSALKKAPEKRLSALLGEKTAKSVLEQLKNPQRLR